MSRPHRGRRLLALLPLLALPVIAPTASAAPASHSPSFGVKHVRFATFNASLNRPNAGQLLSDLSTPNDPQAQKVAEVIQRNRPDIMLVNEFDYYANNAAADEFRHNYLQVGQNGAAPIDYPYEYTGPVNTGVPTGFDLNRDGITNGPDDAYGFGTFPGQYGMLVLSKYPIDANDARTFQKFLWKDMPGAQLPDDPATAAPHDYYTPAELNILRLSSKSHWDLPIKVGNTTVHFLVSHPTPPSFDGPDQRNHVRNHDEIRFWADYITPGKGGYIYDDKGKRGGINQGEKFVIEADMNSDPLDGDGSGNINQILNSGLVTDIHSGSVAGVQAAKSQGGANVGQKGNPFFDTGDFADTTPGNLRCDYVLPSRGIVPFYGKVVWAPANDPLARLNDASDHHMVRVDTLVFGA